MPPTIQVDAEFVLDGWRAEDAAAHRSFGEDADAARWFGWTVEEARAHPDSYYEEVVRRCQDDWLDGSRYGLAIRALATGDAVGTVDLRPEGDTVDVSYFVAAGFRGRGLAPRALAAFLAWAERELAISRARLTCHVENVPSQRVAKKCGFALIGREGDELRFSAG